jgi:sugar O-acyltransferase (sialic acid O-acetyltransferase NeuD family)
MKMMDKGVIIIGAGGHAKVVVSTLIAANIKIGGIFDDDPDKWGKTILGVKIIGSLSGIDRDSTEQALIAVGDNKTRKDIAGRFPHLRWITIVHPDAYVHPSVHLGKGTAVFAKAVIQPDTSVGDHCIVNTGATIDHDCQIDNYVHISPGVNLAGGVRLGEGVFCGIGGKAITGVTVGKWTTIGAGGVIINDLPEYSLAVGVPAKVTDRIKKYKDDK